MIGKGKKAWSIRLAKYILLKGNPVTVTDANGVAVVVRPAPLRTN